MKKIISLAAALAIAASLFAGCSGNTENTPDPTEAKTTSAPTATVTEAPTATPEPTEEPTPSPTKDPYVHFEYTMDKFFDFTDRENGVAQIDGQDGWNFGEKGHTIEYKDGKVVVTGLPVGKIVTDRHNLSEEKAEKCTAGIVSKYDAIGFYFENNSEEAVGICYFGEIKNEFGEHQQVYNQTYFDEIEAYTIDSEGRMAKAVEYAPMDSSFENRGLAEIPAGFKGYYICKLTSLGHDACYYGSWGGHSVMDCENGLYTPESGILNVGISLFCDEEPATSMYTIGEYVLVDFK